MPIPRATLATKTVAMFKGIPKMPIKPNKTIMINIILINQDERYIRSPTDS